MTTPWRAELVILFEPVYLIRVYLVIKCKIRIFRRWKNPQVKCGEKILPRIYTAQLSLVSCLHIQLSHLVQLIPKQITIYDTINMKSWAVLSS
jgi:hypothetical protein